MGERVSKTEQLQRQASMKLGKFVGGLAIAGFALHGAAEANIPLVSDLAKSAENQITGFAFAEDNKDGKKNSKEKNTEELEKYYGTKEQIEYGAKEAFDNIDLAYDIVKDKYPEWYNKEQMHALVQLWRHESGWRVHADNPTSSAYGIPQAITTLHDLPKNYRESAEVQIEEFGLPYIEGRYGSPKNAWEFWQTDSLSYDHNGDGAPDNAHWY